MGTNYYLHSNACEHCGRGDEPLHIGKSSDGWCFGLHVIPEEGLNSLADWSQRWGMAGVQIRNEYGDVLTPESMLEAITQRSWGKTSAHFDYAENYACPGPNGLVRHRIDGQYCVGHGEGTWDLIPGYFS